MSYRYQEILAWIIPGFFLLIMTYIVWGYANDYIPFLNYKPSSIPEFLSTYNPSGQFWNAVATILLFLIPITAMIIGWIVNFLGGRLMKNSWLQRCIVTSAYSKSWKDKNPDAVAEYNRIIRTTDFKTLEYLDRFYYRYVFSRNMVAAQISLMILSLLIFLKADTCVCACGIVMIEGVLAFFFTFIMARDLKTHASFVFNHANETKSPK